MKFLILIALLAYTVNSSVIPENKDEGNRPVPKNICANYPSGTTFPIAYDCNQFILCVNNQVTIGSCTPNAPYFDPCTSMCTWSSYVCNRDYCYDATTTTPYTTTTTTTTSSWKEPTTSPWQEYTTPPRT